MLARIRKALVAAAGSALAAGGSALFTALPEGLTQEEISKAVGAAIAAAVAVGWATYRVRNAPTT